MAVEYYPPIPTGNDTIRLSENGGCEDVTDIGSGKRVVVAGATGMVGSYLLAELLSRGYRDITVLVRSLASLDKIRHVWAAESFEGDPAMFNVVKFDPTDHLSLTRTFREADAVFNCAASVAIGGTDPNELIKTNVTLARNIALACLDSRTRLLVHVSSVAALLPSATGRVDIDSKPGCHQGANAYAWSKYLGKVEIGNAAKKGLRTITVNPATILGWGVHSEGSSAIIPVLASGMTFYPAGVTGWVDARDTAKAMVELSACAKAVGRRFILSSGNCSFKKFLAHGCNAAGKRPPRVYVPEKAARAACAAEKMWCRVSRKRQFLTPEMVSILYGKHYYDGDGIKKYVNFEYSPLPATIERLVKIYLAKKED